MEAGSGWGRLPRRRRNAILCETERQLRLYFDGSLTQFSVPLDFQGTAFQKSVWAALLTIPWGETRSYAQIARQIGRPGRVSRRWGRQWQKSDFHHRALPPGRGVQR